MKKMLSFTLSCCLFCSMGIILLVLFPAVLTKASEPTIKDSTTIFVDTDATGIADGSDWENAYTALQDALDIAASGNEIWVAEGVYYPDEGTLHSNDVITETFHLVSGVEVYGGFNNTESSLDQRNWEKHITVLSGDIDQNDIVDMNNIVTSSNNITGTNSYHVVTAGSTITNTVILDGFTITAGRANGDYSPYYSGGGLLNNDGCPKLVNINFIGNHSDQAGGGIYNENGNPDLLNIVFSGNRAITYGGGMFNFQGNPTLINVVFSGNNAIWRGGGMGSHLGSPSLTTVTFSGNDAGGNGGGIYNSQSNPTLKNVIIWNNRDGVTGIGTPSSSIYNTTSTPTISHSLVQGSNGSGINWVSTLGTDGGSNIDIDPHFTTPVNPTSEPTSNGDLHLKFDSPAIDVGDNNAVSGVTYDLDNNPRIFNGVVDLGAYEFPINCPPDSTTRLFVDINATGTASGLDWINAFPFLQDAFQTSKLCNGIEEIWVTEGVYYPDSGGGQSENDRYASFELVDNLELYGGFNGGETAISQRDLDIHKTVLSGDIDENDTVDSNGIVTDTSKIQGANSYHVVTARDIISTTVMDGFIITAGNAQGDSFPDNSGAGIYIYQSNPTLINLTFSGNYCVWVGGGLQIEESNPLLTDITILNNSAGLAGGGLSNYNSEPTLMSISFTNNLADYGGGMTNYYSNPTLQDVTFSNNTAVFLGGAMDNYESNPTINQSNFYNNEAGEDGGAMNIDTNSNLTLTDVTFSENTADRGAGIFNEKSSPILSSVTFSNNNATSYGGGIYNDSNSAPTLTDVIFSGNTAGIDGGAIYHEEGAGAGLPEHLTSKIINLLGFMQSDSSLTDIIFAGNAAGRNGGGIFNQGISLTLINVTFSGNDAGENGGGMYNNSSNPSLTNTTFSGNDASGSGGGMYNENNSSPSLTKTIFWNNRDNNGIGSGSASITNSGNSSTIITYSLVQGQNPPGESNFDGNDPNNEPHFMNPVDPNDAPTTLGNLEQHIDSPTYNIGSNHLEKIYCPLIIG